MKLHLFPILSHFILNTFFQPYIQNRPLHKKTVTKPSHNFSLCHSTETILNIEHIT